jgi:flavin reductase (DIM6/NTAB) family NADH-FMN oxidoreductase RutF
MPLGDFVEQADGAMFVVTTASGERRAGCLVGFASQVSVRPPRFLVALSTANHTYRVAAAADVLAVHLIGRDDRRLAELFGSTTGDEIDKFTRCAWTPGPDGVPVLDRATAVLIGRVLERVAFGDHVGHVLEPVSVTMRRAAAPYRLAQGMELEPAHPVQGED